MKRFILVKFLIFFILIFNLSSQGQCAVEMNTSGTKFVYENISPEWQEKFESKYEKFIELFNKMQISSQYFPKQIDIGNDKYGCYIRARIAYLENKNKDWRYFYNISKSMKMVFLDLSPKNEAAKIMVCLNDYKINVSHEVVDSVIDKYDPCIIKSELIIRVVKENGDWFQFYGLPENRMEYGRPVFSKSIAPYIKAKIGKKDPITARTKNYRSLKERDAFYLNNPIGVNGNKNEFMPFYNFFKITSYSTQ